MQTQILVSALIVLSTASGFAETSRWVFDRKVSGPASFDCMQKATLQIDNDTVQLYDGQGSSLFFANLNQGKLCQRKQNGAIFGSLRCDETLATQDENSILVERYTCSSDLPFVKNCDTRKDGPAASINIDTQADEMTVTSLTGWQGEDEGVFECVYTRK